MISTRPHHNGPFRILEDQKFDNVRHDNLLKKVAERINDDQVMRLLKLILKASGK